MAGSAAYDTRTPPVEGARVQSLYEPTFGELQDESACIGALPAGSFSPNATLCPLAESLRRMK